MTRRQHISPQDAQKIAAYARQHLPCDGCGAPPGQPCDRPGPGRSVCKSRFVAAAIAIKQEARAARRTPEQAAVLAMLPRVSREEIEACRNPAGGYSFTRAWFLDHGLPYPPPAEWWEAVERPDGVGGRKMPTPPRA
jgi:hypothetical protein